jgi:membrane dipeptidase
VLLRSAACAALLLASLAGCAELFEGLLANRTAPPPEGAPELRVPVADLHADSIMWGRDLTIDSGRDPTLGRAGVGHADLPRLARGGVVLQVFTVFTVTPFASSDCLTPAPGGGSREGCADADSVNLTALLQFLLLGRPAEALSPRRTVEGRAEAFHDLVARSQVTDHPLIHIRSADDLRHLVAKRRAGKKVIGAILGLEGAHPLDPAQVEAEVDWLYGLGYRLVGPVHRFDNAFAGSSEGLHAGPLTSAGERLVVAAQLRGMVVDAAHLSSAALQRAAALATRPVIYSHGGINSNCHPPHNAPAGAGGPEDCDYDRNLTPVDAVAIARTGGVIGVGYWPEAVGRRGITSIVSAMLRVRDALTPALGRNALDHLAIGSDFDGFVRAAVDAAGHPFVMAAIEHTFGPGSARHIGWTNSCRALARALDGRAAEVAFCEEMP